MARSKEEEQQPGMAVRLADADGEEVRIRELRVQLSGSVPLPESAWIVPPIKSGVMGNYTAEVVGIEVKLEDGGYVGIVKAKLKDAGMSRQPGPPSLFGLDAPDSGIESVTITRTKGKAPEEGNDGGD